MSTRKRWLVSLIAALAVTLLIGGGMIRRLDRWMQDGLFQSPGVASGDIVIIGIDDEALETLGPYNTWDRNIMASALEMLASDPDNLPAATGIDVLYAGRSEEQADRRLAAAAAALGNVVTASIAEYGEEVTWKNGRAVAMDRNAVVNYEQPFEELRDVTVQGHINAMYDTDGVMRHALLYVGAPEGRVYSMACETARLYAEKNGRELALPDVSRRGFFYIPYTARPGSYYDGVSIAHLLGGDIPPEYWAGKIVLIGPYAAALQDSYFTPIDKGSPMYGVEIQANVIQSLLEGDYKTDVPDTVQLAVLFILCSLAAERFLKIRLKRSAVLFAGLVLLGTGGVFLLYRAGFTAHPLWLPAGAAILFLLAVAYHYILSARERQALALEKERIGAELAVASRIQTNSLPKEFPPFPDRTEFDIYASMTPAKEVGGDLYDFFMVDEDHLGIFIGDVTGKGVPAALFMMVAASLLRNAVMSGAGPAKALEIVNRQVCYRNPEEMFVTVWLGILEISTGKLTTSNAGHEYPVLKRADGSFALWKQKHGFVIGGVEDMEYREFILSMNPGDKLFVYTDGVPEAINEKEELFGTERMLAALQSVQDETPAAILETVRQEVKKFAGEEPQSDDLTMLCLEYHGAVESVRM